MAWSTGLSLFASSTRVRQGRTRLGAGRSGSCLRMGRRHPRPAMRRSLLKKGPTRSKYYGRSREQPTWCSTPIVTSMRQLTLPGLPDSVGVRSGLSPASPIKPFIADTAGRRDMASVALWAHHAAPEAVVAWMAQNQPLAAPQRPSGQIEPHPSKGRNMSGKRQFGALRRPAVWSVAGSLPGTEWRHGRRSSDVRHER